ncbi:hypothetical protein [Dyadobacter luticola]|uniref:Uncharacterized protein n=1 Tax=Dyadobacter luticola TaxID=1979387 RepID=A0A5R9KNM4_9BACT|nr:hypothetical protein [Dyadobacter luticola]TLU97875.1 hypothetical protein FEN17_24070 [Dyadobacter luticola]
MNALRLIERPKDRELKISLPESFNDDLVEVIVIPLANSKVQKPHSRLKIAQHYLSQSKNSSFDSGNFDAYDQ